MSHRRRVLFVLLTVLVWGLFAFDCGLWQDDALLLGNASLIGQDADRFSSATGLPTRVLGRWIFAAALATGAPLLFLHVLYGLTWLAIGVLAAALGRELFDDRATGFIAGCLTLTATSDYLTNSLVATGYLVSLALCLGALVLALYYVRRGRAGLLWCSALLLAASLWTSDIGLVPTLLAPLIIAVAVGGWPRRLTWLVTVWSGAVLPYLLTLVSGIRHSRYGQSVVLRLSLAERVERGFTHFGYNFAPWRWAFDRPPWFPEPPPLLPWWVYAGAAAMGSGSFLYVALRDRPQERAPGDASERRRRWWLAGLVGACALGTNTAYASLKVSNAFYRTHLGARVWASLALAAASVGVCGYCVTRLGVAARRAWVMSMLAVGGFVGLGVWAGVERQDFYFASWRRHRLELRSLKEAAPEISPQASVVVWQGPHTDYLATDAEYLTLAWMRLLHGPWRPERVWLRSPSRNTQCAGEAEGIRCTPERRLAEGAQPPLLRWESLVVVEYDAGTGRYHLARALPPEIVAGHPLAAVRYAPARLISSAPWSRLAAGLLTEDRLLGRWVPESPSPERGATSSPVQVRLDFAGDVAGMGWEPHAAGKSEQWMVSPVATLQFSIAAGRDLCLAAAVSHYLAPDIPASLRVTANGVSVTVDRRFDGSRTIFSGVVPAAAIPVDRSAVELAFTVDRVVSPASLGLGQDARELGLLFDWLTLKPCPGDPDDA